jgi:hypothetical protein
VAYPQLLSVSALILHSAKSLAETFRRLLSAAYVRLSHAQAAATSPGLKLIIALDHLLSGVNPDSKRAAFSCQEKSELCGQKLYN